MPRKNEAVRVPRRQNVNGVEASLANCKPTEMTDSYWIGAWRKLGSYPKATDRSGKWLVFVPVEQVDEVWEVVKAATESGKLGDCSKVATMRANPNARDPRKKVICIYTYDSDDRADVRRVRQALRELGFTERLAYKTDQSTREGRYRKRGDRGISKYCE